MAIPALRKPKCMEKAVSDYMTKPILHHKKSANEYVIVTMKDDKKLVVPSDSYHGIISSENHFNCVFCAAEMELDSRSKESHKKSINHNKIIANYPHIEMYSENLMRQISKDTYYCTVCNAVVSTPYLKRHISSDDHGSELDKAVTRASIYKPYD